MASPLVPREGLARRLSSLQTRLGADGLDSLVVTHHANVFYLSNFTGSAGIMHVTRDDVTLIIDSRYTEAVRGLLETGATCADLNVVKVEASYEESLCEVLRASGARRVGVEAEHMTLARHAWLERALAGSGVGLCPATALVEAVRVVKDSDELATLREAGRRISTVMGQALQRLEVGRGEREVAADIDWAIRKAGFDRPAFDTIVAAGPKTALPHARPSDRRLGTGELVLLDFGGVYQGYCVDLTRVASLGEPSAAAVRWHEAVRSAHGAALAAVRPGVRGSDVDEAARTALDRRGLGAAFGHGTGHGLGVEVHEAPRIGKRRLTRATEDVAGTEPDDVSDVRLEEGMVFTVEPGVYLPGEGGVRLEDDLVVTSDGYELLTEVSLGLVVV